MLYELGLMVRLCNKVLSSQNGEVLAKHYINRKHIMSYKKPEIVASSEATQSYVAGCPTNTPFTYCTTSNAKCMCGSLK